MGWFEDLAELWWPGEIRLEPSEGARKWLGVKYGISARVNPRRIGEIGVRCGYSAFAMLSASPDASYLGFDIGWPSRYLRDIPALEAEQGALDYSRKVLERFPRTMIVQVDSHMLIRMPPFDLLHIDGDHTFGGLAYDLELAWRSAARWVLVDDYTSSWRVAPALHAFADLKGIPVKVHEDGFRGQALLNFDAASDDRAYLDGTRRRGRPIG